MNPKEIFNLTLEGQRKLEKEQNEWARKKGLVWDVKHYRKKNSDLLLWKTRDGVDIAVEGTVVKLRIDKPKKKIEELKVISRGVSKCSEKNFNALTGRVIAKERAGMNYLQVSDGLEHDISLRVMEAIMDVRGSMHDKDEVSSMEV